MTVRLRGRAAAPGAALAPAFVLAPAGDATPLPQRHAGDADAEVARLTTALATAREQLEALAAHVAATAGQDEAEIFEAHAEFADDPEIAATATAAIADGASAERAVTDAFDTFRALLAASSSEYLAARAEDLDDVRDRVVALLTGRSTEVVAPTEPSVIVARELTPSQTASIPRGVIAALITETGSPTSHAAILARSLGIPAVVACEGALAAVDAGGGDPPDVAVDGRTGAVIVAPDAVARADVAERLDREAARSRQLTELRDVPGATADGRRVELAANIGSAEDLPVAVEAGAEGSGLVRTEFLFQERTAAPTADEQADFYAQVLRAFPGHRVVFRTMDVGADKPLPFVVREPEENPALGLRGIRLHLARPHLLREQLRGLLRARDAVADEPAGQLAIMFPLVATVAELVAARGILTEVAEEDGHDLTGVEVGVMVEVPSAALGAARLAVHADFLSIGTNDLLQYLFAADRLQSGVGEIADVLTPDVLTLIGEVVAAGHAQGSWVGVCGEAASDPVVAVALVGAGVDELSMTRVAIPEVKDQLRRLTAEDCRAAFDAATASADADAARRSLSQAVSTVPV